MAGEIATYSPFINCRGGAQSAGSELYLRLHREYEVGKNIWHKHTSDFDGESWARTVTVNSEDGQRSGAGRVRQDVQSFGETLDISLNNDYNASFNQALYDVTLHGDRYFMDFLRDGVDVKIIQHFKGGAYIEKIYECNSIADAGALYDQLDNADATSDFSISLDNEPTIHNFGFSPALPLELTEVNAQYLFTSARLNLITQVLLIEDTSHLVIDDQWVVSYINKETGAVEANLFQQLSDDPTFLWLATEAGTYISAVGYLYYIDKNDQKYYRYIRSGEITVRPTQEAQTMN